VYTDLSGVVDPLEGHVAENHGQQIRDGADRVVSGSGRVDRLFRERAQHGSRERVVHHALHEHQRQRVRELLAQSAVRASRDLFLEYPVEEIAHEYADGARRELRPFVHCSSALSGPRDSNFYFLNGANGN